MYYDLDIQEALVFFREKPIDKYAKKLCFERCTYLSGRIGYIICVTSTTSKRTHIFLVYICVLHTMFTITGHPTASILGRIVCWFLTAIVSYGQRHIFGL